MAESYMRHYPEILDADFNVFAGPESSPCKEATLTWARWRITEAARRTIFFVNILNFYGNRDLNTGKQLPYYEPFNDQLILNLPLPCSDAAWLARDEEDWLAVMQKSQPGAICSSSELGNSGYDDLASELYLKDVFFKHTKEALQLDTGAIIGFGNSDELRRLIILCATEQYT
jgi:hypothetical protein